MLSKSGSRLAQPKGKTPTTLTVLEGLQRGSGKAALPRGASGPPIPPFPPASHETCEMLSVGGEGEGGRTHDLPEAGAVTNALPTIEGQQLGL